MRALSPPICWQVRELINSSEGDGQYTARGGMINFELFESLMAKRVRDDDRESELKDAFRVLDKDGVGWISVAQMASICKVRALCHATSRSHPLARAHPVYALCLARCPQMLGEDLTEDEVRAMVSEAISNFDERIYYDGLVKIVIPQQ